MNGPTSCRPERSVRNRDGHSSTSPAPPPRLGFPFEWHSNQEFKRQGFKREYAQIKLASWWRQVREKRLKRTVLQQLFVARQAADTIKARSMCVVHDPEMIVLHRLAHPMQQKCRHVIVPTSCETLPCSRLTNPGEFYLASCLQHPPQPASLSM